MPNLSQLWERSRRQGRSVQFAVFGLTALAGLLRLWRLGSQGLWFDETYSVFVSRLPLGFLFEVLVSDAVHPPLYYLLQRAALVFGDSEAMARLPAVIFGIIGVPLAFRLGRALRDARLGLLTSALVALSPFHIWYSREARMYSLLVTLALINMLVYLNFLERPRWRTAGWLALISVPAYLTHYFLLYLPLVQLLHLILHLRRFPHHLRYWAAAQFGASVPLLIWIAALAGQSGLSFGIGWIAKPSLIDLPYTFANLTVGLLSPLDGLGWISLAILLWLAFRGGTARWDWPPAGSLVVGWAMLPVLMTFLLSQRQPVYVDRFLIISLPAFLLLIGRGALSLPSRWRPAALGAVVLLLTIGILRFSFGPSQVKEQWREAAQQLSQTDPAEAIAVRTLQMVVPLAYYGFDPGQLGVVEANRQLTPISQLADGYPGLWLLIWNSSADAHAVASKSTTDFAEEANSEIADWISGNGPTLLQRFTFRGLALYHFEIDDQTLELMEPSGA